MEALVRETEEKKGIKNTRIATFPLIYLLGVATVVGTQVSYWNEGLVHGFWPLVGSLIIMVSGYMCLALCLCEMSGALPFSGGTFGLARVTLGQVPGYLIGAFETVEYVLYVMLVAHSIGEMITDVTGADRKYEPIYWIIFYLTGFIIQLSKPAVMWSFIIFFGSCILIYMGVFIVATPAPAHANFSRFAVEQNSFINGSHFLFNWFRCMPYTSWFFLGVETLPLASGDTLQANKSVPRAIQAVVVTVVCSAVAVVFTASSISPGAVSSAFQYANSPLSYGYSVLLGISHTQATICSIVVKCITGFGFMFAYGRQISAMQKSGLYLTHFRVWFGEEHVFRRGMISAALCGLLFLTCTWSLDNAFMRHFHSACLLGNYLVCLGICLSYIQFRVKFISLVKNYKSPLGVYGARYGIVVFTVAFVSLAGFQNDNGMGLAMLAIFVGFMVLRYLLFNLGKPIISTEEQSVLFVLYVINANTVRKKLIMEQAIARSRETLGGQLTTSNRFSNQSAGTSIRSMTNKFKRNAETISKYLSVVSMLHQVSDDDNTAPSSPIRTNSNSRHLVSNSGPNSRRPSRVGVGLLLHPNHSAADMVTSFDENETEGDFGDAMHLELITRAYDTALEHMSGRVTGRPHGVYDPIQEDSLVVSRISNDLFTSDFDNDDSQASFGTSTSKHSIQMAILRASSIKALHRSFSTADTMALVQPPAEFDTPDRKQSSVKKSTPDLGKLSHKFSASENSGKNGKFSRDNSIENMTMDSFASEERTRAAILDNFQSQSPILTPPKGTPEQNSSKNDSPSSGGYPGNNNINSSSSNNNTLDRWRGRAFSPVQDSIEEVHDVLLSGRLSDDRGDSFRRKKPQVSLKIAPSPRSSQVVVEAPVIKSLNAIVNLESQNNIGIAQKGVSSNLSSSQNSPLPSPRVVPAPSIFENQSPGSSTAAAAPGVTAAPSRFKFNFRLFGGSSSSSPSRRPPLSPVVTHSGKHSLSPPSSHRSMDASILAMYHDEVEEYFSHNSEELPMD